MAYRATYPWSCNFHIGWLSEKYSMNFAALLEELLVAAEPKPLTTNYLFRPVCGIRMTVCAHGLVIARTV